MRRFQRERRRSQPGDPGGTILAQVGFLATRTGDTTIILTPVMPNPADVKGFATVPGLYPEDPSSTEGIVITQGGVVVPVTSFLRAGGTNLQITADGLVAGVISLYIPPFFRPLARDGGIVNTMVAAVAI